MRAIACEFVECRFNVLSALESVDDSIKQLHAVLLKDLSGI